MQPLSNKLPYCPIADPYNIASGYVHAEKNNWLQQIIYRSFAFMSKPAITAVYDNAPETNFNAAFSSFESNIENLGQKWEPIIGERFNLFVDAVKKKFPFLQPVEAMTEAYAKLGKKMAEQMDLALDDPQKFIKDNGRFAVMHVLPVVAASVTVAVGLPLGLFYTYHSFKHAIGRPKLAVREQRVTGLAHSVKSRIQALWNKVMNRKPLVTVGPIFNEEVSRRIEEFVQAIRCTEKNKGFFQNILFYGQGGVGKTMIAEKIAKDANVNFILVSGGTLSQHSSEGENISELNKLFDAAESSSKPTIIFIDEAEGFCLERFDTDVQPPLSQIKVVNAFLNRTGTPSKKIILILATNYAEKLDKAILSRLDHKVLIPQPGLKERIKIINLHASNLFDDSTIKTFFNKDNVNAIAQRTDGFTGRSLFKLLNVLLGKKTSSPKNELTGNMIWQTVIDFRNQEMKVSNPKDLKTGAVLGNTAPAA